MGGSLSPVLEELFTERFEVIAFDGDANPVKPAFFKRYVDDCFAIVETGKEESLLEYLNSIFPEKIKMTMEKEESNRLPFLDMLVQREGGTLSTKVYRKPTHSDRYLHFTSHHPVSVKRGIATGMVDRAITICDTKYLRSELYHIAKAHQQNGYPTSLVRSIIRRRLQQPRTTDTKSDTEGPIIVLPFYCGIEEEIKRLGLSHKFHVYFKSSPNLRTLIRNDKIKVPFVQTPGVVYEIRCDCHASYIRETVNTLFQRFREHMAAVTRYKNAEQRLNGTQTRRRGRPPKLSPKKTMDEAKKASAVVEHTSQCRSTYMQESLAVRAYSTLGK
uniref:Reverse transcriptase domain-containing protein n=1 Tax=Trichuris muris TaxID=70415 RepID=A0A5S6QNI8_TRIMR